MLYLYGETIKLSRRCAYVEIFQMGQTVYAADGNGGGLFVNAECDESVKASAQGLFMLMTNGLGATIGTLLAGQIINHYCQWTEDGYLLGDWQTCWFIFAGYALVVALLFLVMFRTKKEVKA